jgi:hypothetical protein
LHVFPSHSDWNRCRPSAIKIIPASDRSQETQRWLRRRPSGRIIVANEREIRQKESRMSPDRREFLGLSCSCLGLLAALDLKAFPGQKGFSCGGKA